MLSDGQIKRLAVQLDLLQLADSRHESAEKFRAFARACYAEGQRDAQERIAELERDAARYRWLRGDSLNEYSDRWSQWEIRCWRAPFWTTDLRHERLDDAIDAAMRKEGGE